MLLRPRGALSCGHLGGQTVDELGIARKFRAPEMKFDPAVDSALPATYLSLRPKQLTGADPPEGFSKEAPSKDPTVPFRRNDRRQRRPSGRRSRRRIHRSGDRFQERVDPGWKADAVDGGSRDGKARPDRPRLSGGLGPRRSPVGSGMRCPGQPGTERSGGFDDTPAPPVGLRPDRRP
jgi:hypothetical protein